jgi:hypothetical protein
MLLYSVTGMKGGALDGKLTQQLYDAVYNYSKQLKLNRFNGIINIRVPKKKGYIDGVVGGYCSSDRFDHEDGGRYWSIDIDLANVTRTEMIQNLAHEMVHAKQYLKKELNMENRKWKGRVYKSKENDPWDMKLPWEKEAYKVEKVLYKNYINGES